MLGLFTKSSLLLAGVSAIAAAMGVPQDQLDAYRAQLARIDRMLADADGDALATLFAAARNARNTWIAGRDGGTEE